MVASFAAQEDLVTDQVEARLRVGPWMGMLIQVRFDVHGLSQLPATALIRFQEGQQPCHSSHACPFRR
jgi:hypothetical protein